MTMVLTDATSSHDGSASPYTATGPVIVTFSGSKGSGPAMMTMMSRSDTANYVVTLTTDQFGRYKVNLATGDQYYFLVQVPSDAAIDLSVVDA